MAKARRIYNSVWFLLGLYVVVGAFGMTPEGRADAIEAMKLTREGLLKGEVWRLLSYAFLSGGPLDLIFKLLIVFYMGAPLELTWGTRRFLTLFGVSVVGAGVTAALLGVELYHGWPAIITLLVVNALVLPDRMVYFMFFIPMRLRTVAFASVAFYVAFCAMQGVRGLALFAGFFCGVIYYLVLTKPVSWLRIRRRRAKSESPKLAGLVHTLSNERVMERAREIMDEHDAGRPIGDEDRIFIEELIRRANPDQELCSPYSFSPDNAICPPCQEFGRCLKRYVETPHEDD